MRLKGADREERKKALYKIEGALLGLNLLEESFDYIIKDWQKKNNSEFTPTWSSNQVKKVIESKRNTFNNIKIRRLQELIE